MDSMKVLERNRRMTVVAVVTYVACLVTLISVFIQSNDTSKSMSENEASLEEFNDAESSLQSSSTQVSPGSASSSKGVKRKAPMVDTFSEVIDMIANSVGRIADALFEANRVAEKGQRRIYAGEEVFAELQKLEVGDNNSLFAAYNHLMMDERVAGAFFGCPADKRKDFLLWIMSNQHH